MALPEIMELHNLAKATQTVADPIPNEQQVEVLQPTNNRISPF